jgi:AAA+ superfamily predicted ATPase
MLLLSNLLLLPLNQNASMADVLKAGQALQKDVNALKNDVNTLKSTVSQLGTGATSSPNINQPTPTTDSNNEAIEQLTKLVGSMESTLHNLSYFGREPQQPIYTTEAKPGFMAMAAEKIRGDYASRQKFEDWVKSGVDWITQPRTKGQFLQDVTYLGILGLTIPMMTIAAKKTIDTTLDVIKVKMTTPAMTILRPETKYGRMDRLKRWWSGYETPLMIFDEKVKNRLEEIEKATTNIRNHIKNGTKKDAKYRNLLLYGKPGTGKTLFATILADKTDIDILSVSAGDLLQDGAKGKKYFDDLMTMANNSKYGTILFIDEADGLFIDRDILIKTGALDHLIVLDHILGATGSGSNKFMLIAATNHAYTMDPAMGRRFQDRVEMPLPSIATRIELLNFYIKTQLPQSVANILTPNEIQKIATQIEGLSHAEIKDMVDAMNVKADVNKNGILTQDNVNSAVAEAMDKIKPLEKNSSTL